MMSEADVVVGAHATLNCIIVVGFSIFFHYAYSVTPYIIDKQVDPEAGGPQGQSYRGGFLGVPAWVGILNPMEVISATASIFSRGDSRGGTTVIEGASDNRQLICGDSDEMGDGGRRNGDKRGVSEHSS